MTHSPVSLPRCNAKKVKSQRVRHEWDSCVLAYETMTMSLSMTLTFLALTLTLSMNCLCTMNLVLWLGLWINLWLWLCLHQISEKWSTPAEACKFELQAKSMIDRQTGWKPNSGHWWKQPMPLTKATHTGPAWQQRVKEKKTNWKLRNQTKAVTSASPIPSSTNPHRPDWLNAKPQKHTAWAHELSEHRHEQVPKMLACNNDKNAYAHNCKPHTHTHTLL